MITLDKSSYVESWITSFFLLLTAKDLQGLSLTLNGRTVSNNSYLSFRTLGRNWNDALVCNGNGQQVDWHYPNGEIVPQFSWQDSSIRTIPTVLYARKSKTTSTLFREGVPPVLGQYYCSNTANQIVYIHIGNYIHVDDIGGLRGPSTDGLLCHSDAYNHGALLSHAAWYFPNGSIVRHHSWFSSHYGSVPAHSFEINSGYGLVRLFTRGSPSERGLFHCIIADSNGFNRILFVAIVDSTTIQEDQRNNQSNIMKACHSSQLLPDQSNNNIIMKTLQSSHTSTGTSSRDIDVTSGLQSYSIASTSPVIGHTIWAVVLLIVLVAFFTITASLTLYIVQLRKKQSIIDHSNTSGDQSNVFELSTFGNITYNITDRSVTVENYAEIEDEMKSVIYEQIK